MTSMNLTQTEIFIKPYIPLNTALGVQVILTNTFVILHYGKDFRKFVPCMFLLLALLDISMVLCMFSQSAILGVYFNTEEVKLKGKTYSVAIWAVLLATVSKGIFHRISIFCNVVFSVARTYKIVRPFNSIKMRSALLSVIIYGIFWEIIGVLDLVELDLSKTESLDLYIKSGQLGDGITGVLSSTSASTIVVILLSVISYVIPVALCITSFMVLCIYTQKSEEISGLSTENTRHVTYTVFWITILFEFTTACATFYFCLQEFYPEFPVEVDKVGHSFFYITLPLINAGLSPVIIILRCRELRKKLVRVLICRRKRGQNVVAVGEVRVGNGSGTDPQTNVT